MSLGIPQMKPSRIYSDSESALKLIARGAISPGKSRHMDIRYFKIRDLIQAGIIELYHVPGTENPADMFTKPLHAHQIAKYNDIINNGNYPEGRHFIGKDNLLEIDLEYHERERVNRIDLEYWLEPANPQV